MDYDSNQNARISYKIIETAYGLGRNKVGVTNKTAQGMLAEVKGGLFLLNPTSGDLRLNFTRRNLSDFTGLKKVHIKACDSGVPQLCSLMVMRIVVSKSLMTDNHVLYKEAHSPDVIVIAVSLATVAILLIILMVIIAIRCRRQRKEVRSYSIPQDTNRSEYSLGRESVDRDETQSLHEDEPQHEKVEEHVEETTQNMVEPRSSFSVHQSNQNLLSPANAVSRTVEKLSSHSDGDSGRGDSEPDNSCFHSTANNKDSSSRNRKMGSMCNVQCLRLGHSDKCWMPQKNEQSIASSRNSVATVQNETVYNWNKMKPRFYNSPMKSEYMARYGRSDSDLLNHNKQLPRTTSSNLQQPEKFVSKLEYSRPSSLAISNRRYSSSAIGPRHNFHQTSSFRQSPVPRSTQSTPCEFNARKNIPNIHLNTLYEDANSPQHHQSKSSLRYLNDQYRVSRSRITHSPNPTQLYPYRSAC